MEKNQLYFALYKLVIFPVKIDISKNFLSFFIQNTKKKAPARKRTGA